MLYADPFELIKEVQSGLMLIGRRKEKSEDDMQTIFLIKEDDKYIKKLGYNPIIQIRTSIFDINNVLALFTMIKINNNNDMLYDGWFNYYSTEDEGIKNIDSLIQQNKLIFKFYNTEECKRTIGINNNLKDIVKQYKEECVKRNKWEMKEFDNVKNYIYNKYSNGQILWNEII